MATLYKDSSVIIDDTGIIIRNYYFPTGSPKRIPWSDLQNASLKPLTWTAGKWRLWGMNFAPYWFNWDWKRLMKSQFIALDTGRMIKPAITPDDPEIALAAIESRMLSSTTY